MRSGPPEEAENVNRTRGKVRTLYIPPTELEADLAVPRSAKGLVLFAHGSGSGRLSPRNTRVAAELREAGLATLLFDLLTPVEAADRALVFDIGLLAERLLLATQWIREREETCRLQVAYFGASTGAAAALVAAAAPNENIGAVVSRGGRPDLAAAALPRVRAPTLLIVGGNDAGVIDLNREAQARLRCKSKLEIVPGAGHLFEEPGTLDIVIALARAWFLAHLTKGETP
jgi:putative phosphoribosyl transferase